jgi:hypothetical protein
MVHRVPFVVTELGADVDPFVRRDHPGAGRGDNVCLGAIVRCYENGPTYAWWHRAYGDRVRLGACSSDQAARAAVKQPVGQTLA